MAIVVTCDSCGAVMDSSRSPKFPLNIIQLQLPLLRNEKGEAVNVSGSVSSEVSFSASTNRKWCLCQRCFDIEVIKAAAELAKKSLPEPILASLKKTAGNIL